MSEMIKEFFSSALSFLGGISPMRNYTNYYFLIVVGMFIMFIISTVVVLFLGAIWAFFPALTGILLGFALTVWYTKTKTYREKIHEVRKIVRDAKHNARIIALNDGDAAVSIKTLFLAASRDIDAAIDEADKMGVSADEFQKELVKGYRDTLKNISDNNEIIDQKVSGLLSTIRTDKALLPKNTGKRQ